MTIQERYQAIREALEKYYQEEFQQGTEDLSTLEELKDIGIAYTEADNGYPIQVTLDLDTMCIYTYVGSEMIKEEPYSNVDEIITVLNWNSFSDFCQAGFEYANNIFEDEQYA